MSENNYRKKKFVNPHKKQNQELAETLAKRVVQLREGRNMTVLDLARATRFSVNRIDEIESGIELALSVPDRSVLARALGVLPAVLREVELDYDVLQSRPQKPKVDLEELAERVLAGEVNLECPKCGQILRTAIETALDFEGRPTEFARAYCPVCPFAIR